MARHSDTGPRPPLMKRLRAGHWVALDCGLAAVITLAFAAGAARGTLWYGLPRWAVVVLAASTAAPVAVRRLWPAGALVAVTLLGAAGAALGATHAQYIPMVLVMYMAGLRSSRRTGLWLLGGALLVTAAGLAAMAAGPQGSDHGSTAAETFVVASAVIMTASWVTGYSVRQQRAYTAGLREQAEQRALDQVTQARRASSEERLRIAREMHDVVAHTLSLIAVQAGVASYVAVDRPQEAARALSSIEQTSRGALNEMRALLGVLRTPEQTGDLRPAWPAWTTSSAGPRKPASGSTLRFAASVPRWRRAWTWPPTGSSRRRSPTWSSTRRRTAARSPSTAALRCCSWRSPTTDLA
jgi:signal transduction histidine kinase